MQITEVKVYPVSDRGGRLQAFASITIDHCLVIHDLKVIQGDHGLFVTMPSRKKTYSCPECKGKNQGLAYYCNWCGIELTPVRTPVGEPLPYIDIVHPLVTSCRLTIQEAVLQALQRWQFAVPMQKSVVSMSGSLVVSY